MIQQAYKYVGFSFWPCLTFFSRDEDYQDIEIKKVGTGKELVAMRTEFVFPVELSAYQVSMVCAANWLRYSVALL